jgi:hypothetical protein
MALRGAELLGDERTEEGFAANDVGIVHAPVASQDPSVDASTLCVTHSRNL